MYPLPLLAGLLGASGKLPTIAETLAARGGFWLHGSNLKSTTPPAIDEWVVESDTVTTGAIVQSTGAAKPDIETVAGVDTAQFDTDEFLKSNASAASWNWMHAAAGYTLFVVWRRTGGSGTHTILDTCNGNVNNHGTSMTISAANVLNARVCNGSGTAHWTASLDYDNWSGSVASMSIAEVVWSSAGGYELRIDGGTGSRLASGTVTGMASSSDAMGALTLGAVQAGSVQFLTGNIAEVAIFVGVCTNAERRGARKELAARHSITLQS